MLRSSRANNPDMGLLLAMMGLLVISLLAIYSASLVTDGIGKVVKQGVWIALGLIGFGVVAHIDYRSWSRYWRLFYVLTLVALFVTLFLAREINGARSWIDLGPFRLQPSEFAKLALIIGLATLLARFGDRLRQWPLFLRTLLFLVVPLLLVLMQPDFGTGMVWCAIWFVMVLLAGVRWWMLLIVCLGSLLAFTTLWHVGVVSAHQKARLIKRLDFIHADPAGAGYHQRQAGIAIGAGMLWGKGYLHGTQARRGFLPEQDTDFIFAVIGEEFGFLGCAVVLGLFAIIFLRLLRIAEEAETPFGRLVVVGVVTMFMAHTFINVGMCLGVFPVAGIPLPFVSYGGSSLLTNMLAAGMVYNISRHRQPRRTWAASDVLVRL